MKQIKTVIKLYSLVSEFDAEVNALLAEGWHLVKREFIQIPSEYSESFNRTMISVLYAELEKESADFEKITL